MHHPLISVVIPTYNREQYLGQAIDSVLEQDCGPVELIVVDDGSTDRTPGLLAGYAGRLRAIRQDNRGFAAARNAGVALATGPFLAFLDSDDVWLPDKLTRQMAVFVRHPVTDVVYGQAEQFLSPELGPDFASRLRSQAGVLPAPLASAMLIRRQAFDRVGPFDPRLSIGVEMDWQARAGEAGLTTVMLPDVIFRRRLHRSNINIQFAHQQSERLRVLKAALDRRRRNNLPS